jgi:hypothetical protein
MREIEIEREREGGRERERDTTTYTQSERGCKPFCLHLPFITILFS